MKYQQYKYMDGGVEVKLEIEGAEIEQFFKSDQFTCALQKECVGSKSVADKLLLLEHVVRKMEDKGVQSEVSLDTNVVRY